MNSQNEVGRPLRRAAGAICRGRPQWAACATSAGAAENPFKGWGCYCPFTLAPSSSAAPLAPRVMRWTEERER